MIYRVQWFDGDDGCHEFFGSRRAADRRCAELRRSLPAVAAEVHSWAAFSGNLAISDNWWGEVVDEAPTPKTKAEVIALLQRWAEHY